MGEASPSLQPSGVEPDALPFSTTPSAGGLPRNAPQNSLHPPRRAAKGAPPLTPRGAHGRSGPAAMSSLTAATWPDSLAAPDREPDHPPRRAAKGAPPLTPRGALGRSVTCASLRSRLGISSRRRNSRTDTARPPAPKSKSPALIDG